MAHGVREVLTVLLLCIAWYTLSCGNSVIGKLLLTRFPFPLTVTLAQLASIALYSGPTLRALAPPSAGSRQLPRALYWRVLVPLSLGKFVASVLSHVSIWRVPVSFANTVKASMPLFTVVLARLITKERQTTNVYASLVPIITGVTIATLTELSFDATGMMCALVSTAGFSLQHIYSKKVLQDTGMHHLRLLHILGRLAFFLFLPIWFIFDFGNVIKDENIRSASPQVLGLLFASGFLCYMQNIVAFSVISMVAPLTYAVANASKRIFVIAVSLCILGNPVTSLNIFGMMLAIFGVLCYNKAKYDQKREQSKTPILPMNRTDNNKENALMKSFNMMKSEYSNGHVGNGYHLMTPVRNATSANGNHSKLLYV